MTPSGSRVGFAVTIASIFVLCCATGVAAASHLRRPPATLDLRTARQAISATLTKSLGLTPETACAGRDSIAVRAGTQVYTCYTLTNTGSTPFEPLTLLDGGALINWVPPAPGFLLNPGATLPPSTANGLIRPFTADTGSLVDLRAEWYVDPRTGTVVEQVLSNPTTLRVFDVASLQTTVRLTAGLDRNSCSTAGVTIPSYSTPVYYCVTIQNGSPIPLTGHVLNIPALGLSNLAVPIAVGPAGTATSTLRITNTVPAVNLSIPPLAQPLAAPSLSVVATVTSSDSDGDLAVTSSSAPLVVSGPPAGITLVKTSSSNPSSCSNLSSVTINSGDRIYYCLTVTNSNSFTFTHHTFAEPTTNISGSFQAILPPGGRITLTNATLPNYGVAPVLGPLVATESFNKPMNFTAVNPVFNYQAAASASASVSVIPATPTPTDEPTPTFTSEPFDTPTPTPSLTPFPPTPTWTATWTPSPTFTPSPTVLAFTTPGGVPATPYPSFAQVGQGQPPTGPFTSPLDPFAATATASALFGFPTPIVDPFAATATASALFGFPTPFIDPYAATATAAAALAAQPASPLATLAPEVAVLPPSTVIVVTATPTVDLSATPTQRPVAPGSPPAQATGGQQLFSQILDSAGLTVAFLWLLGGFVVMFLVMGVLAGLSIKPKTQGPYSLTDREDANYYMAEATAKPQPESDEPWPDALP